MSIRSVASDEDTCKFWPWVLILTRLSDASFELFLACLPGLESLLARECAALSVATSRVVSGSGGVTARGEAADVVRLMRWLSCASHVTVRLGQFRARHFAELERRMGEIDWRGWLGTEVAVTVHARAKRSKLIHSGALEQRLALAISRARPMGDSASGEAVAIHLRMFEDVATLSLDGGGRPLHERGWRLETAKAPLREDLAAALLLAGGIDDLFAGEDAATMFDPMCGSGTIVIEAAIRGRGLAPGRLRQFPLARLPRFFAAARADRDASVEAAPRIAASRAPITIFAADRDEGAVAIAARNAERAGVADGIVFEVAALSRARAWRESHERLLVACNPPYGVRIGNPAALGQLWQTLGARVRERRGARLCVIAADRRAALRTGLPLTTAFLTTHGGLKVRGLVCEAVPVVEPVVVPVVEPVADPEPSPSAEPNLPSAGDDLA